MGRFNYRLVTARLRNWSSNQSRGSPPCCRTSKRPRPTPACCPSGPFFAVQQTPSPPERASTGLVHCGIHHPATVHERFTQGPGNGSTRPLVAEPVQRVGRRGRGQYKKKQAEDEDNAPSMQNSMHVSSVPESPLEERERKKESGRCRFGAPFQALPSLASLGISLTMLMSSALIFTQAYFPARRRRRFLPITSQAGIFPFHHPAPSHFERPSPFISSFSLPTSVPTLACPLFPPLPFACLDARRLHLLDWLIRSLCPDG